MATACLYQQPHPVAAEETDIPLRARVVLSKAVSLMNQKDYQGAIERLTAFQDLGDGISEDDPDPKGCRHARIYYTLGTCHLLKGNHRRAAAAYKQALEKDPAFISAWLNLAKTNYELGDFLQAAKCFNIAYDRAPEKNPEHLYFSAAAFLMAERSGESVSVFKRLFQTHVDAVRPAWRENYVHALLTDGHAREALPHLRKLVESDSEDKRIQWQELLLNQFMHLGMWEEAGNYARLLTREAPTVSKWWKALVHIRLQDGTYGDALAALIIYGYLTPLSDKETKLIADLYLQLGIPVKAAPVYEAALTQNPNMQLLQKLMLALRQLGESDQALAVLDRFAPDCKDADLLMLKADLLYDLERFGDAARTYRHIARAEIQEDRAAGRAWLMAGYAALRVNDIEAGRKAFTRAAKFESQRKAAQLAIERLSNESPSM